MTPTTIRRLLLSLALAALLLAALAWTRRPPDAGAAAPPGSTIVTDLAGRRVALRTPVRRVILGEGRQLYLVAALDTGDPLQRLVGWRPDLAQADPDTYAQYLAKFPKLAGLPVFGRVEDGGFDIERAIALQPDLIILNLEHQRASDDARLIDKLAAAGIAVVYVDFRHRPVENTEPTLRLLGTLFDRSERAEALIAFRAAQLRRVTDVIAARQPARPRVFIERGGGYSPDCCMTFGDENFGRYVEMAGGRNIAKALLPGTFGHLNPEQVLAADPQHVVVTSANWEAYMPGGPWIGVGPGADLHEAARKLQGFTQRPAYTGTAAQRDRRFHAIWHQFYNSPYQFVAVQHLARWFHPELFADLDPDAAFRELHERFLPVPYRPGYAVSLAEPPQRSATTQPPPRP
jgi:iron complex transport system substrate-binding protein